MNGKEHNGEIEFTLTEYLDGNLDSAGEAALAARLETDAELREGLRQYAAVNEYLQPPGDEVLDGIDYDTQRAEILARIERKALLEGPPRRRLVLRPAFRVLAAAATILLVFTVSAMLLRSPEPTMQFSMIERTGTSAAGSLAIVLRRQEVPPITAAMPAGTIVVSIGGPVTAAQPTGMFGFLN